VFLSAPPTRSAFGSLAGRMSEIDWRRDGWRDLACALFLIAATWHLAAHDGGKPVQSLLLALVLALPVLAATWPELSRSSRFTRAIAAGWAAGPLLALAAAEVRAGWLRPLAVLALAVPAFLAVRHLWRRPAGPLVIGLILGAGAARAWGHAFMAFWGGSGSSAWLAVSWHNQSATLMGAMAILGFGIAVASSGWPRAAGFALALMGGSATWLAASRAGFILALLGLLVGAVVAARLLGARRTLGTLAAVVVLSAGMTAGLGSMTSTPGTGAERLVERGLDRGNLMVRFDYWQGAWGMVAQAPLTGTGPGSYRWSSTPWASLGTSRSASVHNEYLEILAGHGILGALPVWIATLAGAWLVLGALLGWGGAGGPFPGLGGAGGGSPGREGAGGPSAGASGGRQAGLIAAAGALALFGTHAGFDFDWDYAILLVGAAAALAVLSVGAVAPGPDPAHALDRGAPTGREPPPPPGRGSPPPPGRGPPPSPGREPPTPTDRLLSAAACGLSALLVAVAVWGVSVATPGQLPPWELDGKLFAAVAHASTGATPEAREVLATVERWNPGAPSLPAVRGVVEHAAGDWSDQELAEQGLHSPSMDDRLLIAERLLAADALDDARRVLDALKPFLEERLRWRIGGRVVRRVHLQLMLEEAAGGCPAVWVAWESERAWASGLRVEEDALLAVLDPETGPGACLVTG